MRTLVLTGFLIGVATAPLQAQAARWAGCYELSLGPWTPALNLGGDTIFVTPPPRIQLDTVELANALQPGFRVRPAPGAPPSVHRFASWTPVGEDGIVISWSTGFSGLSVRLHAGGDALRGEAMPVWDFPRPQQTAPVTARRVACDAPRPSDSEVLLFSVQAPDCPYQEIALPTGYPDPGVVVSRTDAVESLERRVRKLGGPAIVGLSELSGGVNSHGGITGTAVRFTDPGGRR